MTGKIALKRLTRSDLTIFQHHHETLKAGHQKSINLNADVFINQLYPGLPLTSEGKAGYLGIDLQILGPGLYGLQRLQRKITKKGTYKNWRLNGEIIPTAETAERFNALAPGDYVVFDFSGDFLPTAARVLFVAKAVPVDAPLHQVLDDWMADGKSMAALGEAELEALVRKAALPEEHPAKEFTLGSAIEDAALGGIEGARRLLQRRSGSTMNIETLQKARQNAENVGRDGEELINTWLEGRKKAGGIRDFTWVSDINAIAPYDFIYTDTAGAEIRLDVKSTSGPFGRRLHISMGELLEMAETGRRYDLYRVYALDNGSAHLRVAEDLSAFATRIVSQFSGLPQGVEPDGVSVAPDVLKFGREITIRIPEGDEE